MLITVLDDHPLIRVGIKGAIKNSMGDVTVEGFESVDEMVEFSENNPVDIAITDLSLRDQSGFEYIRYVNEQHNSIRCIVYTSSNEYRDYKNAIDLGVKGYVRKDSLPEDLMYAIKSVQRGRSYVDSYFMDHKFYYDDFSRILTNREFEVFRCIGKGFNNTKISDKLFISINTVKKHVSQIFSKLQVTDRTELVLMANDYFGGQYDN
ncbi:response regulator transcription factor [Acidaminobacter sp. JC074]|uniref:response regulator transcription factor n=1 Tax=Acidaminobacter sp. JC074 TaxID=2530199 RepID=UPI001F0DE25F|nr:response regulator transcription factor [Acidaminobacter sp. JC074]MCH4890619.1 response regulator transcription factor [Acidaminobacter sp. JC074]